MGLFFRYYFKKKVQSAHYLVCFLLTDCKYIDYILYINIYIYNISTIKRVEHTG